jgi:hypothetical protein
MMSVSMTWDERQNNIVMLTFSEEWTWREATVAFNNALAKISNLPHTVALIFNLSLNTFFPANGLVEHVKLVRDKVSQHPNVNLIVVVMPRDSTRDMLMAAAQMYGSSNCTYKFLDAVDDAYATVAQKLG